MGTLGRIMLTPGTKRYLTVCLLFIFAATIKAVVDESWWREDLWRYLASTLIIVPIIWYAGYFFKQAEYERNRAISGKPT